MSWQVRRGGTGWVVVLGVVVDDGDDGGDGGDNGVDDDVGHRLYLR